MNPFEFMVFAFMMKILGNDLPHMIDYMNRRPDIVAKYGKWAVGRAEAVCPMDDADCVEKYAAVLQRNQLAKIGIAS